MYQGQEARELPCQSQLKQCWLRPRPTVPPGPLWRQAAHSQPAGGPRTASAPRAPPTCVCATRFWCSTKMLNQVSLSSAGRILGGTSGRVAAGERGKLSMPAGQAQACRGTELGTSSSRLTRPGADAPAWPLPRAHHSTWPGV